jgi:hypothetical protein
MHDIINTFKQGGDIWKNVGFQQSLGIFILLLSVSPIIVIIGILLLIVISNANIDQSNFKSMVELVVSNPFVLLFIFILLCIGLIFLLISIGIVQKIAHNYTERQTTRFKENFNLVISKIGKLCLVGITTILIAVIPLQLLIMVLVPIKAAAPSILGSNNSIDLDLVWDTFEAVSFSFIFALVAGPGFLSISAIIIDDDGLNAFITGWKLFSKAPVPTLGSMIIIWLSYLSIFLFSRFMLVDILLRLISDELMLSSGLILSLLILISITLFVFSPLFFTVMYSLYSCKYRGFILSNES